MSEGRGRGESFRKPLRTIKSADRIVIVHADAASQLKEILSEHIDEIVKAHDNVHSSK